MIARRCVWTNPATGEALAAELVVEGWRKWHRATRDYCAEHGIAFFDKHRVIDGRLVKLPPLDGQTHDAMPEARR